jgi:hypothetical protein
VSCHRWCQIGFLLLATILWAESSPAEESETAESPKELDRFEFGALAFGDAYWVAANHQPEDEGIVSAWLRRAYLTFDSEFTQRFFGRLRFEINQAGDFDDFSFEIDFKDLYLQTAVGEHRIHVGLTPTPTFDVIEPFWGYRHVERTPMDIQGVASRDTGISAKGPLTADGSISYRVMYGTQLEFGADSNDAGEYMVAVAFNPDSHWLIDLYADFGDFGGTDEDRLTLQAFAGFQTDTYRLGLQYSNQDRGADPGIELASAFGVLDFSDTWSLLARVDRLFKPSPRGEDIAYLPFDPTAKATLLILGIEARPYRFFSVIPNIEYIRYDDPPGIQPRPGDDLLVRLTFFLKI